MSHSKEKEVSEMRLRCKDKSDYDFVDAFDSTCEQYENTPRQQMDWFNIDPNSQFGKDWDNAIKEYLKEFPVRSNFKPYNLHGKEPEPISIIDGYRFKIINPFLNK